jgi:hypothetical protein
MEFYKEQAPDKKFTVNPAALWRAACHRLSLIAGRLGLDDRAAFWLGQAAELREPILARAWNPTRGALTGALDPDIDPVRSPAEPMVCGLTAGGSGIRSIGTG